MWAVKSVSEASVRMRIRRIKKYSHYPQRKNRGLILNNLFITNFYLHLLDSIRDAQ